jgi:hypothetical protein
MVSKRIVRINVSLLLGLLAFVPIAAAQQASGIAGVVRDTSGAVLPGVTVEASSPALIEKVRTVVADGEGRYNIVDLRPGTYTVTFTLAGFNTIKREGVVLTAGFTATVNADMQVGALEETITVTGASPLVDTQNTRQQTVVSSDLLAVLPSGGKGLSSTLITLVPGVSGTTDVGGSSGLYRSNGQSGGLFFHGKSDITAQYDGLGISYTNGTSIFYFLNPANTQETTIETGGGSAQINATLITNVVPREGANRFGFDASGTFTNQHLQSDNLTDELRARGVTANNKVLTFYDASATFGGPIKKDRLWFFTATRASRNKNTVVGLYFNKTIGTPFYTPDLDRPAYRAEWLKSIGNRLTWQVSEKNKVSVFGDLQAAYNRGRGEFRSPEAYMNIYNFWPQGLVQATWSSPRTNKLLLEAGWSLTLGTIPYASPGTGDFASTPDAISITELSRSFVYNAKQFYSNIWTGNRLAERFSMSYVTGSHAMKAGAQVEDLFDDQEYAVQGDLEYQFLNGVPTSLTQWATPYRIKNRAREIGLFVQDQWTRRRLTLHYGLRFDALYGWTPAQPQPAVRFVPARDFAPVHKSPDLTDLNPRVGASYDLFGTGHTALKVSFGRYVEMSGTSLTRGINPLTTSVLSVNRTWNDANGNYVPDCTLENFGTNGECGPIADLNFGQNNPRATRYADDVLRGFGNRNYGWDFGTEVQHELRSGMSVTAGYYRNWAGNFRVTDNQAVTPGDFSPYCVTAPVDARLPGGGGYPICGLYDINPNRFGQVSNVVTAASHFYETQSHVNCGDGGTVTNRTAGRPSGRFCGTSNFFSVSLNTRFGKGIQLNGGVDTGRTVIDNCFVVDSPQQLLNCRTVIPFKAQTQVKALGSVPLPGNVVVSGTFQGVSGRPIEANWPAPNNVITPSLGRNLAACGTRAVCTQTAIVPLVAPYTMFLDRRTQLDLRLSKLLNVGPKARLRANVDVYNVLNGSAILGVNNSYGSLWLQPAAQLNLEVDSILPGRLVQFGGQLTF